MRSSVRSCFTTGFAVGEDEEQATSIASRMSAIDPRWIRIG
jgi:hypothetical protein